MSYASLYCLNSFCARHPVVSFAFFSPPSPYPLSAVVSICTLIPSSWFVTFVLQMKNRSLKFGLAIGAVVVVGAAIPIVAVVHQQ